MSRPGRVRATVGTRSAWRRLHTRARIVECAGLQGQSANKSETSRLHGKAEIARRDWLLTTVLIKTVVEPICQPSELIQKREIISLVQRKRISYSPLFSRVSFGWLFKRWGYSIGNHMPSERMVRQRKSLAKAVIAQTIEAMG